MSTDTYLIRFARPDDLATLPTIEHAAATLFRTTAYATMVDADLASPHVNLDTDLVWVAVDTHDHPIAFAIVHELDDSLYLHELDVDPQYARRGLGRRLIETVAQWARTHEYGALTLSTFRDIPWNGLYYVRLGFRPLNEAQLSPGLRTVRQVEADAGLPLADRICMRLDV